MAFGDKAAAPWLNLTLEPHPTKPGKHKVVGNPSQRPCGDCTLCCRVLPVAELEKPAGIWCQHAMGGKGCAIYADRPFSCSAWSCLWAATKEWPEELQPRRSHVIFDMMTDSVALRNNVTGESQERSVIQLWVDPRFPNAYRAPIVRRAIEEIARMFGMATLVRIGSWEAFLVLAPGLSPNGDWFETRSNISVPENSAWPVPA